MVFGLNGLKVLVTASTRGIGRGIAEVLLEEGAVVTINGRYRDKVDEVVNELKKIGHAYGVAADLTEKDDVYRLVLEAYKLMNGLDAVIYVTGPPKTGRFSELEDDDWDYGTKLLVLSAIWVSRASIRYLQHSENPSMVFVTSIAVKEPVPNLALSNILRISVHGLVKTLSQELGPLGIRVNGVMPGYILTERLKDIIKDRARREGTSEEKILKDLESGIPLRRVGLPRDVGYLVAFLLSKYASYITGAIIPIDGGLLRHVP